LALDSAELPQPHPDLGDFSAVLAAFLSGLLSQQAASAALLFASLLQHDITDLRFGFRLR
jgi:hypothetical protein